MGADIGVISGLIELKDNFSSQIGLAEAALSNFSKQNQESLKAIAEASGLVVAAYAAITAATVELVNRGSEVNNVDLTLQHFAGSATAAADVMEKLRSGTKNTVDDFNLAKDAAHVLSAGVKLTADDFGVLGQAAYVLHTRGLGGTKEQLDLVSDALVTGRTRTLAMSLGVIDAGDAEQALANKLGVHKELLSATAVAEAKRTAVLDLLTRAVKDAGNQQKTLGDQLLAAKTFMVNWEDELASAVAKSPVLGAAFKSIGDALADAFGNSKEESIKAVTHFIENVAISAINFGLVAIETARVFNVAWSAIKVVVLAVERLILNVADEIVQAMAMAAAAAEKVHLVAPGTVQALKETKIGLDAMTESLTEQMAEATKGLIGQSDYDKTLDHLGGTLYATRDAMIAAKDATVKKTDADTIAANNTRQLAALTEEHNRGLIDQAKYTDALIKSTAELNDIWEAYFRQVAHESGNTRDAQIADIEATFNEQVNKLDALDPLYMEKYNALRQTADDALQHVGSDWDSVKDKSIRSLNEQAAAALETYLQMTVSGDGFTRKVLDEQLAKYHRLRDEARGWGDDQADATKKATDAGQKWGIAMTEASAAIDGDLQSNIKNVRTLAGAYLTAAEAKKQFDMGTSFDVTSANFDKALGDYLTNGGWNPNSLGIQQFQDPYSLAKKGYSFAEILKYAFNGDYQGPLPPPQGPRIPGFAEGGTVMVGENGPEVVRLPLGATVYPSGVAAPMSGAQTVIFQNVNHINGTAQDVARQMMDVMMRQLKNVRQFGAA